MPPTYNEDFVHVFPNKPRVPLETYPKAVTEFRELLPNAMGENFEAKVLGAIRFVDNHGMIVSASHLDFIVDITLKEEIRQVVRQNPGTRVALGTGWS